MPIFTQRHDQLLNPQQLLRERLGGTLRNILKRRDHVRRVRVRRLSNHIFHQLNVRRSFGIVNLIQNHRAVFISSRVLIVYLHLRSFNRIKRTTYEITQKNLTSTHVLTVFLHLHKFNRIRRTIYEIIRNYRAVFIRSQALIVYLHLRSFDHIRRTTYETIRNHRAVFVGLQVLIVYLHVHRFNRIRFAVYGLAELELRFRQINLNEWSRFQLAVGNRWFQQIGDLTGIHHAKHRHEFGGGW